MDSPCIGICKLDLADICIGCGRHVSEIIAWPYSTEAEQLQICERARERLAKRRPGALNYASSGGGASHHLRLRMLLPPGTRRPPGTMQCSSSSRGRPGWRRAAG